MKTRSPVCCHCQHEFDTDEMMDADGDLFGLATREETVKVECPNCCESFWLAGSYAPEYESSPTDPDEE